jgi:hypothetical protein
MANGARSGNPYATLEAAMPAADKLNEDANTIYKHLIEMGMIK